ncbi:unnamed protein product [Discosporangium mesarthrocarpum]
MTEHDLQPSQQLATPSQALCDIRTTALEHIEAARKLRRQERLKRAAKFTQVGWRRKKGYTFQEDKLQTQQQIQDVFEKADNTIREPTKNKPMVVRETKCIVNIGGTEVSTLTHAKVMDHIRQVSWPLVLRFRRPLDEKDILSLARISTMRNDDRFTDDVVLEHLKRKLVRGQILCRFPTPTRLKRSKPYLTRLSIDENTLYYESEDRIKNANSSRVSISLYNLRFVVKGKTNSAFRTGAKTLHFRDEECFSIVAEGKTLNFAVPAPVPDDGRSAQRCDLLVWGLKRLIQEMEGSQIFVDKDGIIKRRVNAKTLLTTIKKKTKN